MSIEFTTVSIGKYEKIKIFHDVSKEYEVYYTIHLDENLNISDFNNAVTKAYLDTEFVHGRIDDRQYMRRLVHWLNTPENRKGKHRNQNQF